MSDEVYLENYKKQLKKRLRKAVIAKNKAYKNALNNPTVENINWLNNRRMDEKIIRSRIENLGKPGTYFQEYHLPEL